MPPKQPSRNFTRENAVLIHIQKGLPDTPFLRSGVGRYTSVSNQLFPHQELKEQSLPLSVARHTLHFTLSHVVPPHAGMTQNQDVAIIIPLSTLPEELTKKILGTPEDIFLFTDRLELAGATLLIPKSLITEYKGSKLKAMLGLKIKCSAYADGSSLTKAFVEYATIKNIPYLTPRSFVDPKNPESPVDTYQIVYSPNENYVDGVSTIFGRFFQANNFLMEHSLHKLNHIELFLATVTEAILQKLPIDFMAMFRSLTDLHGIYRDFQDFKTRCLGQGSKLEPQVVQLYCPGYSTFPYDGDENLLNLFRTTVLAIFDSNTPQTIKDVVAKYHADSSPYFDTLPELQGYRAEAIRGDGNCMYNAVIAALNTVDNRAVLVNHLGVDENNWLTNLRNLVANNITPMLGQDGGETLRANILHTVGTREDFHGDTDADALNFYINTIVRQTGANNWGDEVVLRVIARIFDLDIHVHHQQNIPIVIGDGNLVIHIFQHGEVHFDAYVAANETRLQTLDQIALGVEMDVAIDTLNATNYHHDDEFMLPGSATLLGFSSNVA